MPYPPSLTVLKGGNPEDNYAATHRDHLKFVQPTPTPVEVPASPRPTLAMRIIDDVIVTLIRWQHSLEMYRVWLEWRRAVPKPALEEPVASRGW